MIEPYWTLGAKWWLAGFEPLITRFVVECSTTMPMPLTNGYGSPNLWLEILRGNDEAGSRPGANVMKLFMAITYKFFVIS
jgi:hypothetical protein